ncbi:TolC family protein [Janthinobacterium fluminis]|uniref:TolC family protein n=1 Tax=Janthinobacterium fluminis TaxID=2987524 RepID=A0ABT5K015_9BURK|nr:TolC family protein [Janthinobacterium fluminis]MDC8758311.1 TolC family protein [Janthinobacterium fluminis]
MVACLSSRRRHAAPLLLLALAATPGPASAAALALADVVRQGLSQNPGIRVEEQQIEVARAQQQQTGGQFDWVLSSALNYKKMLTPLPPSSSRAQTTAFSSGYQIGLSKQLRNGIVVGGNLNARAAETDLPPLIPQQNVLGLDLTLALPLLRGSGAETVRAGEDVAKLNVLRSRYELRSRVAQTVYRVVLAYWDYRAQVALRNVAQESEQRSQNLLASYQRLVDAAEKPRADLVLLKADLADKAAALDAAALALSESRKTLGRLLALDLQASNQLPEPGDPFPAVSDALPSLPAQRQTLGAAALARRPDVAALALQREASRRQLQGAVKKNQAQLDLNVGVTYGKASEHGSRFGFIQEAGRTQSAPSLFASLNYQFPIGNNLATGEFRELSALAAKLEIQQRDLQEEVAAGVDSAAQQLSRSAAQLQIAGDALALYKIAVSQEIAKQRNGIATLIDVINIEGRFVSAQVNFLRLQLAYSNALARLRFETGTMFRHEELSETSTDHLTLELDNLVGLGSLLNSGNYSHPID